MIATAEPTHPLSPAKPQWHWPAIIIGLLALHICAMLFAVTVTLRRPGESAVIPDYYSKEQAWDAYKTQLAAAQKLGWNSTAEPTGQTDIIGNQIMKFTLSDARGQAVAGADISVHCFHLSHGDEAATLTATSDSAGQVTLTLPRHYKGFWQFDVSASRDKKNFIQSLTQYLN